MSYYIKLKNNVLLTHDEVEKIRELQLDTYDERFEYKNKEYSSIEKFGTGTKDECLSKINSFGEIKKYFDVIAI